MKTSNSKKQSKSFLQHFWLFVAAAYKDLDKNKKEWRKKTFQSSSVCFYGAPFSWATFAFIAEFIRLMRRRKKKCTENKTFVTVGDVLVNWKIDYLSLAWTQIWLFYVTL